MCASPGGVFEEDDRPMSSHRGDRPECRTLVELLRAGAERKGDALLYRYLRAGEIDGPVDEWAYGEVDRRARAVAAAAGECSRRGERALLLYPAGLDFIAGFFGCLYAGIVAVPLYPPDAGLRASSVRRLFAVADDARPSLVLTTGELMRALRPRLAGLAHLPWVATDETPLDGAAAWSPFEPSPDDLAFLQYTSGSTGDPKGVMLSHRNILANEAMLARAWQCDERTPLVSWLPLFHDMGLITQVVLSLYAGSNVTLMSPLHFLQRPARWLRAISQYRAEISGGPNFAFDLCAQKTTAEERAGLELGRWRVAFNGAEPVRAATLRRFAEVFAPHGFRQRQLGPCYGLAEATVFVSAPVPGAGPTTLSVDEVALSEHRVAPAMGPGARELVASGEGWLDEQIVIVDPETRVPCAADRVGEIWVSGPHVGRGYWGRPEVSELVFCARRAGAGEVAFLRTGDLGFLRDGQLFVTGRRKDMLIVRGRNHYPQDIELTVEASHPRVRPGCSAVFALEGEDRIVVVAEVDTSKGELDFAAVGRDVRAAVADEHELRLHAVVLLEARSVPKTSSGKIQRRACRTEFMSGGLRELHRAVFASPDREPGDSSTVMPAGAVGAWLVRQLAERLGVAPGEVDVRRPFRQLGLDSKDVVALSGELSRVLGVSLSPTIFYDHPTVGEVVRHLEGSGVAPCVPASAASEEPIALIGLGCRFPGGVDDAASYWRLLCEGRNAITEVPADRWDVEALHDPTPGVAGRMYVRKGGFIGDVAGFDAAFFDIAPREARSMDPQQRLLLEIAYEALDDAGMPHERLAGSRTGVFVGVSSNDYGLRALHPVDPRRIDGYAGTGNAASVAAGRISYLLGLAGPSLAVDTACSSSLVAVHLACQSLRAGECDMALAGGVNLLLSPDVTIFFCQLRALAPDGQCKPFDAAADGFVRSEGCGVVALKRLADAVRDGDRVLCVIRGTAVNQDGRSNGLAAPNGRAQQACVREALARAGLRPADVDYVEAHGTGTRLGDPVEVRALAETLGPGREADAPLLVGSVKANLGHCEAAAGVAGLIKVALMLRHGAVPAQLHIDTPNPLIPWNEVPVRVATEARPWPRRDRPRIAGVSSFGISGTNAHVIVEEAPPDPVVAPTPAAADALPWLLPLSARCPAALRAMAAAYRELLTHDAGGSFASVVYTAAVRRTHHPHRLAVVGRSAAALIEGLDAVLAGEAHPVVCEGRAGSGRPKVVLVFPGQGSQWAGMGRQLFAEQPVFRDAIVACDAAMRPHTDWSLVDVLADPSGEALGRIDVVQPVLMAIEVGLAALWRSWGVVPDVVVGHSMGEVAAAHVAGALTLDDAACIICRRSRLLRTVSGLGAMALVELPDDEVARRLEPYRDVVSVAISNSARSTVFSGATAVVEALVLRFQAEGVFCRRINVDVASHGPQMDALAGDLLRELAGVSPRRASVPMYSTVDAALSDGQSFDAAYWVRNLREPVRFARAIEALSRDGDVVFVEVSPHPILLPAIEETARATRHVVVASLRREQDESSTMFGSLARLFCSGVAVDFRRLAPVGARCIALPRYPWQRERHWIDDDAGAPVAASVRRGEPTRHPLLGRALRSSVDPSTRYWESTLRLEDVPYLADHRVDDAPVMPAAAFLEMALAAGRAVLGRWPGGLRDVAFVAPLHLEPGRARLLQLVLSAPTADAAGFRIASAAEDDDGAWTLHATGQIDLAVTERPLAGASTEPHGGDEGAAEAFYSALAERGLAYGPCFQGVRSLARSPGRASAVVEAPPAVAAETHAYGLHPAVLDACFQVIAAAAGPAIPVALERLRVHEPQGLQQVWCDAHAERQDGDILGAVTLRDSDGRARVEVIGLRARPRGAAAGRGPACLGLEWRPDAGVLEIADDAPGDGAWLLLADWAGVGERVRAVLERRGHAVVTVHEGARDFDPGSPTAFEGLLRDSFGRHRRCRGVVHLWSLDALDDETTTGADVLGNCGAALHLVQALGRMGWRDPPRLWFVTRGAQAIGPSLSTSVAAVQAPLWGLANVLRYEHPELACVCIDLASGEGPDEAAAALVHELLASDDEELIARRDGQRHVGRLTRRHVEVNQAHALPEAQLVRPDGAYLITGGLGGLGLSLAAWLVRQGARHLTLVGRRGAATPNAERVLAGLRDAGAEVTVVQADVASRGELARALVMLEARGPVLRGVVHAAGLLDDGLLVTQDLARLARVLRPKVDGALNLHLLTQGQPLDFFVLYSSAAALLGSPGQGPYAAANAFLDALAHRRRALGLPALSVNWGPFADVGLAAEGGRSSRLGERGVRALAAAEGEALLGRLLALGATQAAPVALDMRQWLDCNPQVAASTQLSELVRDMGPSRGGGALVASLREQGPGERRRSLERLLRQQAAAVLRTDLARVALDRPLQALGLDSLTSLELRNRIEAATGLTLPATVLWTHPTIAALARHLATELDGGAMSATSRVEPPTLELDVDLDFADTASLLAAAERELRLASD